LPGRDPWSWSLRVEGPAAGGAAYNRGGQLADAISGTGPKAIEAGAGNAIEGAAEGLAELF
jgi:hypothetical protein